MKINFNKEKPQGWLERFDEFIGIKKYSFKMEGHRGIYQITTTKNIDKMKPEERTHFEIKMETLAGVFKECPELEALSLDAKKAQFKGESFKTLKQIGKGLCTAKDAALDKLINFAQAIHKVECAWIASWKEPNTFSQQLAQGIESIAGKLKDLTPASPYFKQVKQLGQRLPSLPLPNIFASGALPDFFKTSREKHKENFTTMEKVSPLHVDERMMFAVPSEIKDTTFLKEVWGGSECREVLKKIKKDPSFSPTYTHCLEVDLYRFKWRICDEKGGVLASRMIDQEDVTDKEIRERFRLAWEKLLPEGENARAVRVKLGELLMQGALSGEVVKQFLLYGMSPQSPDKEYLVYDRDKNILIEQRALFRVNLETPEFLEANICLNTQQNDRYIVCDKETGNIREDKVSKRINWNPLGVKLFQLENSKFSFPAEATEKIEAVDAKLTFLGHDAWSVGEYLGKHVNDPGSDIDEIIKYNAFRNLADDCLQMSEDKKTVVVRIPADRPADFIKQMKGKQNIPGLFQDQKVTIRSVETAEGVNLVIRPLA